MFRAIRPTLSGLAFAAALVLGACSSGSSGSTPGPTCAARGTSCASLACCTATDTCTGGVCTAPPTCAPTGSSCASLACCTATDVCAAGTCSAPAACAGTGGECTTAACCNSTDTCVDPDGAGSLPLTCIGAA